MQLFGRSLSLVFALPCRIPHNRLRKNNGRSEMCMLPARRDVCFGGQRFREVVWFVLTHPSGDMPGGVVSGFAGSLVWLIRRSRGRPMQNRIIFNSCAAGWFHLGAIPTDDQSSCYYRKFHLVNN